jgi:hypothetical protein
MLIAGGLFAGGVLSIAWERIPAWRKADPPDFQAAFAHTLRRVDRLRPGPLAVCLISTIGFALSEEGAALSAVLAAAGFLIVLLGSAAWLVPIQRRLVASSPKRPSSELERLRAQWLRGHLIRTALALASLTLAVVAAVS